MDDGLITRLRAVHSRCCDEAAVALEVLTKHNAELEAECERDQRNAAMSQQESVVLLNKVADMGVMIEELQAEADRVKDKAKQAAHFHADELRGYGDVLNEAREAVKRLAYAVDALLSGERDCDVIAVGILNDDVVKRIVEG